MITKVQTEIQQAAIYRCTDKTTHEVFYTMKSDSTNDWYTQRYDRAACEWTCDCPAAKPCKHLRAVQEILKIRRARLAKQMGGNTPQIVATLQAEEEVRAEVAAATVAAAEAVLAEARAKCSLNAGALKFEMAPSGRMVPMR